MRVGIFALVLTIASVAQADETKQHVVKKGDTCASIAQQYYGDARLVEVLHKANAALAAVPPPHNLKEGSIILVPPKPGSDNGPDARLTTVRNKVEVLAPKQRPGKPKDPLYRGNRVSTEASSAADVTFRDESQVKLGERTLVVILGDVKSAAKKEETAVATSLLTGNLRAFMSPKAAAPMEVQTPSSKINVAAAPSTEVQVSTDDKKAARLAVYTGNAALAASGVKRDVQSGFGSKAELGKAPTVPRPLPPAPKWSKLPLRVLLDRGAGAPPIIGEYDLPPNPVTPATTFHVQVSRDGVFHDVIVDTKVPAATKRFEGKTPGPGHYWIRISAIDNDEFEGPYSDVARVLVVHPIVTAEDADHRRIVLDPPSAACMRIGNVRLTWVKDPIVASNVEPVRLRCSSHEADPTTLLDIDHLDDFPNP